MASKNYFPLGIAKKAAFCNREKEREQLKQNIDHNRHTIIISPRRYGKSSLALYALDEIGLPYDRVDLFVAIDSKTVANQILQGVRQLINKVSTVQEQTVSIIKEYFKQFRLKWIIGTSGFNIELIPANDSDVITNIKESLQILEHLLSKKKQRAALFIDEFQEVGELANNKGIEGAIRHVAQESEFLTFIFSGSNRHILAYMFDDRSSPLYMLCDRINLKRIEKQHYEKYIQKAAMLSWNEYLENTALEEIFALTECHPYYVNVLCHRLLLHYKNHPPKKNEIQKNWNDYALQEESKLAKELSTLNHNQRKILMVISKEMNYQLSGKIALAELDLSSGAVVKNVKALEEKDYIYKDNRGHYHVLDPLIKTSLHIFYSSFENKI